MESYIVHGDCLEEMPKIPDGSVDCIINLDNNSMYMG